jgi:hypothetical protein
MPFDIGSLNRTHGKSQTVEYKTWKRMRGRCFNKNDPKYPIYGSRGISICERWEDFENFLSDVGLRPSAKHSIDRIDVNGNYEPSNVRWATATIQARNQNTRKDNTSGCRGVIFVKPRKKWQSYIHINKKRLILGYFLDIKDAIEARKKAEISDWLEVL